MLLLLWLSELVFHVYYEGHYIGTEVQKLKASFFHIHFLWATVFECLSWHTCNIAYMNCTGRLEALLKPIMLQVSFMFLFAIVSLFNWDHPRKSECDWQVLFTEQHPLCAAQAGLLTSPSPFHVLQLLGGPPHPLLLPSHLPRLTAQHLTRLTPLSFFKNRFSFEENHLLL